MGQVKSFREFQKGRSGIPTIVEASSADQIAIARMLFEEYAGSIGIDLCFQGFANELKELPGKYVAPLGGLFIAFVDELPVGCVAIRPLEISGVAELKRLYVRPKVRGRRIGWALTQRAIERAKGAGYERICLDTLPTMQEAQRLYRELGFREIPAYTFNPVAGVVYMELDL